MRDEHPGLEESRLEGFARFAKRAWEDFRADMWGESARVQPLSGWLILALVGLVAYLTLRFAPAQGTAPGRLISVEAGLCTIGLVAVLALVAGFQPYISRWYEDQLLPAARPWFGRRSLASQDLLKGSLVVARVAYRLPSTAWSFLDYVLARPLAVLVGATQPSIRSRYIWGALIIISLMACSLFAPPPYGLYAALLGMLAILAILRRWMWMEDDRQKFLIERGGRDGARRVSFEIDLRDQALVGLTLLLLLIPLALRQVQLVTCAAGAENCAFALENDADKIEGILRQLLGWLGFFGAELAKAVPFVDWSEVFHVANESPIKPKTTLGRQIVFAMRASLDLLLLAAVVQAVQVAGRLHNQKTAFEASNLPILDPFEEARRLRRAGDGIDESLELRAFEQPSIAGFPAYDRERLGELVCDNNHEAGPLVRRAAVALLDRQHGGESTNRLFTARARAEANPEIRNWILTVAGGLAINPDPDKSGARRERLRSLLADPWEERLVRAAAARALGRLGPDTAAADLLIERLKDHREHVEVRADAAVALSKMGIAEARSSIRDLAEFFRRPLETDVLIPVMATAYACVQSDPLAHLHGQGIEELFRQELRPHALRAACIQHAPMSYKDAIRKPVPLFDQLDQTVLVTPGTGPFSLSFLMGGDGDPSEEPPHPVTIARPFSIGRFPVTQEEYLGFCIATRRAPLKHSEYLPRPATGVPWRDAMMYCDWLNRITGERYRLPTEAEWEYACRGGKTTRYSWGDTWDNGKANSSSTENGSEEEKGASDVDAYDPNPWGLWDMHGNAAEWCADPWHDDYADNPPTDGSAWIERGDFTRRVQRGGSRFEDPRNIRSAFREADQAESSADDAGFRIVRTL